MTIANFDAVATSEQTLITAASATTVLCVIFCNADTVARVVNIFTTPSAGASKKVLSDYSIPAGDTFIWSTSEKFVLATGDKVTYTASAKTTNEVVATISYYAL